jgi:flagellar export protein FliJ
MNDTLKASLKRLDRLVQIRQTYVSVAETAVKQAENELRRLEAAEREVAGHIRHTQEAIAYLDSATGHDVQSDETYLKSLETQRKQIQLSIEKANSNLEQRRQEWTEAMREEKIAAKLQERRLHQLERADEVAQQKAQDDAFIGRYVRTRLDK